MALSTITIKEELSLEESFEVNEVTLDMLQNANETVPYPIKENGRECTNESGTPFSFVGIKMEKPNDYESEESFANLETKYSSEEYTSHKDREHNVDDQFFESKLPTNLNNTSCIEIKMECEEDSESCKSDFQTNEDTSMTIDVDSKINSRSVVHGCDMGHSSNEFIRGIECQVYPILRVKEDEEKTDTQIAANRKNSAFKGASGAEEENGVNKITEVQETLKSAECVTVSSVDKNYEGKSHPSKGKGFSCNNCHPTVEEGNNLTRLTQSNVVLNEFLVIRGSEENGEYRSWSHSSTRLLIDAVTEKRSDVGTNAIRNKKLMWEAIASTLKRQHGMTVTRANCENRWKVLVRNYKRFVENNRSIGRGRKDFEYAAEMDAIFIKKRNTNSEIILPSSTIHNLNSSPEPFDIDSVPLPQDTALANCSSHSSLPVPSAQCTPQVPSVQCALQVPSVQCTPQVPSVQCALQVPSVQCAPQVPSVQCAPHVPSAQCAPHVPSVQCTSQVPSVQCTSQVPSVQCTPQVPSVQCTPQVPSVQCTPQVPSVQCTPQVPSIQSISSANSPPCGPKPTPMRLRIEKKRADQKEKRQEKKLELEERKLLLEERKLVLQEKNYDLQVKKLEEYKRRNDILEDAIRNNLYPNNLL